MTPNQIDQKAAEIHNANVLRGWWDDPDRCVFRSLQLVNTEIAEATEGDRKALQDSHLPHRLAVEVEIGDTVIRLLDLAGHYGWRYEQHGHDPELDRCTNLGAMHFFLTRSVCDLGTSMVVWLTAVQAGYAPPTASIARVRVSRAYCRALDTAFEICRREGYDLWAAVDEKLKHNATRPDHDREARAHSNGKKY